MIDWFARNGVAANLLMVSLVALGIFSLNQSIPVEVFPQIELDTVDISVVYRGATPAEVEESVVIRIEEAIHDLEGIKRILSIAEEGGCRVTVEVENGYDSRNVLDDVQSRVEAISTLPEELENLIIMLTPGRPDVLTVVISGDMSERDLRKSGEMLRDDLAALPNVSQVVLGGVRPYEISIEVSERTLQSYGLTLEQVALAVRNTSLDLSAGGIKSRGGEILIHAKGRAYREESFRDIVLIARNDGTRLTLGDVARIRDGFEETPLFARINGNPCVLVTVRRTGTQNAIVLAEEVKDRLERIETTLPPGVELDIWNDYSKVVEARLKTLTDSAVWGGILVLLILALFLRPALAFWVCLGIPVTFFGAIALMPILGATINIVSLFGFILVLGIVVDDAIVTSENIYTHVERGTTGVEASIRGTREVTVPVVFGVLTTVTAFIPILMIEGFRGKIFAQIPMIVIPVLLFSLVESKLILPSHMSHIRPVRRHRDSWKGWLGRMQGWFGEGLGKVARRIYFPLLERALHWRYASLSCFIFVSLLLFALLLSNRINFVFFPRVDNETARVSLTMPPGTPEEVTAGHIDDIVRHAEELREELNREAGEEIIRDIMSVTGGQRILFQSLRDRGVITGSSHLGEVAFSITPPEERTSQLGTMRIVDMWRERVGSIAGVKELTFVAEIARGGAPVDIQLVGSDHEALGMAADEVKDFLSNYPQLFDINHNFQDGKSEIRIRVRPEMELLGLDQNIVARQARAGFYGFQAQRIPRGRDDVRVMVRYPRSERSSHESLNRMHIRTRDGQEIPFASVVHQDWGRSAATILRIDRQRAINVRADADKMTANLEVIKRDLSRALPEILSGYPGIDYTFEGEAREQAESFASVYFGLVLVIFFIYSLLAIPFKSYFQPLMVMSVIPFGISGAILGHIIMGLPVSMMSVFGMLALSGVLVNDSLVLVDHVNRRVRGTAGGDFTTIFTVVCTSGLARFRPIMLTSMTTFAGLTPIMFEQSTQAQFLIPMAVSLGWGVLFGTFVTLILIPINYLILEDFKRFLRGYWHWQTGRSTPTL